MEMSKEEFERLESLDQKYIEPEIEEAPEPVKCKTPVKKKRSRFDIGSPEKVLQEAKRKQEEENESNKGSSGKKRSPQQRGKNRNKNKYRRSY